MDLITGDKKNNESSEIGSASEACKAVGACEQNYILDERCECVLNETKDTDIVVQQESNIVTLNTAFYGVDYNSGNHNENDGFPKLTFRIIFASRVTCTDISSSMTEYNEWHANSKIVSVGIGSAEPSPDSGSVLKFQGSGYDITSPNFFGNSVAEVKADVLINSFTVAGLPSNVDDMVDPLRGYETVKGNIEGVINARLLTITNKDPATNETVIEESGTAKGFFTASHCGIFDTLTME